VRPGSASSSGDVDVCIHKTVCVEHTGVYWAYFMAPGVQELDAANGRSSVPLVYFYHVLDAQRGTGTSVDISKQFFYK
jgi:hypothetical protein